MLNDKYKDGFSDGFNESEAPKDAFTLNQYLPEYQAGYVMGVCSTIHAPVEYWATLAGERAAGLGVQLEHILPHVAPEHRHAFSESYQETMDAILEQYGD